MRIRLYVSSILGGTHKSALIIAISFLNLLSPRREQISSLLLAHQIEPMVYLSSSAELIAELNDQQIRVTNSETPAKSILRFLEFVMMSKA
jgi:hypothetical protein